VNEYCLFLTLKPENNAFTIRYYSNRKFCDFFPNFFHFLAAKYLQPYTYCDDEWMIGLMINLQ